MSSEDPLFSLIQSLTQHEKRYIRLEFSQNSPKKDGHLSRLFLLIDRQAAYDESALKAELANDALGRQFAVHKNLLYHAILRCLQSYRYENSAGMKVRSGIDKVEILVEKGKQESALKLLLRTRKLAEEMGQHGYILELLAWERRILRFLHPLNYLDSLPRLEAYERKWLTIIRQESEAMGIYDRLFAWVQVERRMERSNLAEQLQAVEDRLAILEADVLPCFNTLASVLNAKALIQQLHGDYQGMMDAFGALLAHWDLHPQMKTVEPQRYARLQIAWLNSLLAAGQIGQHLADIRALRKMPIQGNADHARTVFQSYNLELLWLLDQKNAESALRFLHPFEEKLPEMLPFLDDLRLNSLYLNAAILYFSNADYKNALDWAQRIRSMEQPNRDTLFFRNASLLSLISNCEIGNLAAAESQLASIGRRLSLYETDWEFGRIVVEWMAKLLPKMGTAEEMPMKLAFQEVLKELEQRTKPVPMVLDLIRNWAGAGK